MYKHLKRLFDFVLSTISLIIFSPVIIILSVIIKINSKGPVLFKQRRIGLNGKEFTIYKFRSMRIDTPNVSTEKLGDPALYITSVGAFLRKTSLDELPQLLNIFKGDMSIVGPRPALYNQYDLIEKRENQEIHSIRPGLTGYAQVMGRDFLSDDKKVEYDKNYLENMSFVLDIVIIFKTFFNVIKAKGIKI